MDNFDIHHAGVGVGLEQSHGEIARHFLGEFTNAVDAGIDHGAHAAESWFFGKPRKFCVVEVDIANEVIVFAFFDCLDFAEEGTQVIDAAEVFEV